MFFASADNEKFSKVNKRLLVWVLSVVLVLSALLWGLYGVLHIPSRAFCEGVGEYSLMADTQAQREGFFAPFGYRARSVESFEIIVPSCGEAFEEYNEIQKSQGLNLSPYAGKKAQMYVFSLESDGVGEMYGFLMVYKGRVIGGHISDCNYPSEVLGFSG